MLPKFHYNDTAQTTENGIVLAMVEQAVYTVIDQGWRGLYWKK